MRIRIVKIILLGLFFLVFALPLIQKTIDLIPIKTLNGHFEISPKPSFNIKDWFEGEFQNNYDSYANDNIGFRSLFIRSFNQLNYNLYKTTNTKDVIIGNNNILYSINNIEQYYGLDTIRQDILIWRAIQLERITDTLRDMGVDLILAISPSKAAYMPKDIPSIMDIESKAHLSNYKIFRDKAIGLNINLLDLSLWLCSNRDNAPFNLFSNTGIHWSQYGVCKATDTILKYSEKISGKTMPRIIIDSLEVTNQLRGQDQDIETSMNLLFNIPDTPMPYPIVSFDNNIKYRPRFLCIGDSYYWDFFTLDIPKNCFGNGEFWYYFKEVHGKGYGKNKIKDVDKTKLFEEFKKNDIILITANDANFFYLARVISEIYNILFPNRIDKKYLQSEIEKSIDEIVENIEKTPSWYKSIQDDAKKRNISFDKLLRENAEYVYRTSKK